MKMEKMSSSRAMGNIYGKDYTVVIKAKPDKCVRRSGERKKYGYWVYCGRSRIPSRLLITSNEYNHFEVSAVVKDKKVSFRIENYYRYKHIRKPKKSDGSLAQLMFPLFGENENYRGNKNEK